MKMPKERPVSQENLRVLLEPQNQSFISIITFQAVFTRENSIFTYTNSTCVLFSCLVWQDVLGIFLVFLFSQEDLVIFHPSVHPSVRVLLRRFWGIYTLFFLL